MFCNRHPRHFRTLRSCWRQKMFESIRQEWEDRAENLQWCLWTRQGANLLMDSDLDLSSSISWASERFSVLGPRVSCLLNLMFVNPGGENNRDTLSMLCNSITSPSQVYETFMKTKISRWSSLSWDFLNWKSIDGATLTVRYLNVPLGIRSNLFLAKFSSNRFCWPLKLSSLITVILFRDKSSERNERH